MCEDIYLIKCTCHTVESSGLHDKNVTLTRGMLLYVGELMPVPHGEDGAISPPPQTFTVVRGRDLIHDGFD